MQSFFGRIPKGFEGYYEITKSGIVRSLDRKVPGRGRVGWSPVKGKIIKPHITNKGYYRLQLCRLNHKRRYSIHRLLAINFIPNPKNYEQINHINGIRLDNRLENLEWCSSSHNNKHTYIIGHKNHNRKLSDDDVIYIRKNYIEGVNASDRGNCKELAERFGIASSNILKIINRKTYYNVPDTLTQTANQG